jgi:iron(III) transport system ATP-binding protein
VDLTLPSGKITCLLGASGSGKSTLLRLLAGFERPERGILSAGGERFDHLPPEKRRVGMVFQDYALFSHLTVEKNVAFGLKGLSAAEKKTRVKEVLTLVDLDAYGDRYPHTLSGGQQQRVALARALAPRPRLLLLDEPFSNLDRDLSEKIRGELRQILKTDGVTTLFVTHDEADAAALADFTHRMSGGRLG